uniref:Apple domain-containing protein n=1 Tax=Steinernema glaseri TaxID=37863 RepID=A0A1I8A3K5_9BILA
MSCLFALCVLLFFPYSASERHWKEWKSSCVEEVGYNHCYYSARECCNMCEAGDKWFYYRFVEGRCLLSYESVVDLAYERTYNAPTIYRWEDCCFFCGKKPGDYLLVRYRKGWHAPFGYCEKRSQIPEGAECEYNECYL